MGNVVITSAARTTVGAYLGSLKTVPSEDLVKPVLGAQFENAVF